MGAPIPVLGYRSRTDAVIAMLAEGKEPEEIAEVIGINRNGVAKLAYLGKRKKRKETIDFRVSEDTQHHLRPHAEARGIGVRELVVRLLQAVAKGHLVDAVLDDKVAS